MTIKPQPRSPGLPADENLLGHISRYLEQRIDPVSRERELWSAYGTTVAAMVLDSSGFSRVSASHGIVHCLARLVELRVICALALRSHNCMRLQYEADNVFAIFPSVADAISGAMAMHLEVHRAGLMLTERERFRVCIGIGYGRMLYAGNPEGFFSRELNFASKLGEDVAEGDETLLTENAWRHAPGKQRQGFRADEVYIGGMLLPCYRHRFNVAGCRPLSGGSQG